MNRETKKAIPNAIKYIEAVRIIIRCRFRLFIFKPIQITLLQFN